MPDNWATAGGGGQAVEPGIVGDGQFGDLGIKQSTDFLWIIRFDNNAQYGHRFIIAGGIGFVFAQQLFRHSLKTVAATHRIEQCIAKNCGLLFNIQSGKWHLYTAAVTIRQINTDLVSGGRCTALTTADIDSVGASLSQAKAIKMPGNIRV